VSLKTFVLWVLVAVVAALIVWFIVKHVEGEPNAV